MINMTNEKRYTCCRCHERYMMVKWKYSQRSMTALKKTCESKECQDESYLVASMKHVEKKRKDQRVEKANKRKIDLDSIKTLADWKNDLQKVVNWIIKKLDKDLPCISHPNMKSFLRWDAGHFYTVKSHSDIRFNSHNIHKQNSQANEMYGGCPEYVLGLRNRYGLGYSDMVLGLPLEWKGTGKEKYKIETIRNVYLPNARKLVREIKNGFEPTRDQVNEIIGIYIKN